MEPDTEAIDEDFVDTLQAGIADGSLAVSDENFDIDDISEDESKVFVVRRNARS